MSSKREQKKLNDKQLKLDKAREDEEKKIMELRQEMANAKQLNSLSADSEIQNDSSMSWMYSAKKEENPDDLLLGKKKVQPRFFVEEYFRIKEKEVPGALFIDTSKYQGPERDSLLHNLDTHTKDREDPLVFIQSAQSQAIKNVLADPKKLKEIEKLKKKMRKEEKRKEKKEKKEKKKEQKESPENDESKKRKLEEVDNERRDERRRYSNPPEKRSKYSRSPERGYRDDRSRRYRDDRRDYSPEYRRRYSRSPEYRIRRRDYSPVYRKRSNSPSDYHRRKSPEKSKERTKLTEEEKQKRLEEMTDRSKKIQEERMKSNQVQDSKIESNEQEGQNFLNDMKKDVYLGGGFSVEDRIKRNMHSLQKKF